MTKKAVLYARVSSDDRHRLNDNLEGQLEMCREYALKCGYEIVTELAEDDRGAKGASLNLEKLIQAREMAHRGEYDVLVVREIDRFARRLVKQLVVEKELRDAGVEVDYVLGDYPDTPEGNLNKQLKAVIAEYEAASISTRTRRARLRIVREGNVMVHGQPPYGYRVTKKDGKRTLEICESEAKIIRMIYELYTGAAPLSIAKITRRLTQDGIPTPSQSMRTKSNHLRAKHWNTYAVYKFLSNETYAGMWRYGKARHIDGHTIRAPKEQLIKVAVPAIVSREIWELAQRRLATNKANAQHRTKYKYLLQRRVTCGCCARKMGNRGVKRKHSVSRYYYCLLPGRSERGGNTVCTMTQVFRVDQVDAVTWEWIKASLSDPDQLVRALEEYTEAKDHENGPTRGRLDTIDSLIEENNRSLEKVLDLYISGEFTKEMLLGRKTELETILADLCSERAKLAASIEVRTLSEAQIQTIYQLSEAVRDGAAWADESFERRREMIELLNVQATLAVEDGEKVVYLSCEVLGKEDVVSLVTMTSRSEWPARRLEQHRSPSLRANEATHRHSPCRVWPGPASPGDPGTVL